MWFVLVHREVFVLPKDVVDLGCDHSRRPNSRVAITLFLAPIGILIDSLVAGD